MVETSPYSESVQNCVEEKGIAHFTQQNMSYYMVLMVYRIMLLHIENHGWTLNICTFNELCICIYLQFVFIQYHPQLASKA